MALTNAQALALRELVDQARAAALSPDAVRARARDVCAGLVAASVTAAPPGG